MYKFKNTKDGSIIKLRSYFLLFLLAFYFISCMFLKVFLPFFENNLKTET